MARSPAVHHPTNHPPFRSVLLLLQTNQGWGPARLWSAVQCDASQDFDQFPVPGHKECKEWQVLSQAHSLALSKWTAGAALFWANSRNRITHTLQIAGEISLDLVNTRSKTEQTPIFDSHTGPRFN
jgi:hypothetical protein